MAKNDSLSKAKTAKNDEFYTQLDDIIAEIAQHPDYVKQFENKTVFMNCDDPESSNFVEFFRKFFKKLKLKKIISTHFNMDGSPSYKLEWSGEKINGDTVNMIKTPLEGNGDFRSPECIELLKESDIVVTNPPFSLFREYVAQLMEYDKKFLILGNPNAITYKEIFPLLKENNIWLGYKSMGKDMYFHVNPEYQQTLLETKKEGSGYVIKNGEILGRVQAIWYTNLDNDKRHEPLILTKNYKGNEDKYPKYDNYDAINCDKVADIPKDYFECIAVPITFIDKYCPEQFEIIDANSIRNGKVLIPIKSHGLIKDKEATITDFQKKKQHMHELSSREDVEQLITSIYGYIPEEFEYHSGIIGVPITFLDKYCPEQFELYGIDRYVEDNPQYGHRFSINGKETYARVLIRRKP